MERTGIQPPVIRPKTYVVAPVRLAFLALLGSVINKNKTAALTGSPQVRCK